MKCLCPIDCDLCVCSTSQKGKDKKKASRWTRRWRQGCHIVGSSASLSGVAKEWIVGWRGKEAFWKAGLKLGGWQLSHRQAGERINNKCKRLTSISACPPARFHPNTRLAPFHPPFERSQPLYLVARLLYSLVRSLAYLPPCLLTQQSIRQAYHRTLPRWRKTEDDGKLNFDSWQPLPILHYGFVTVPAIIECFLPSTEPYISFHFSLIDICRK